MVQSVNVCGEQLHASKKDNKEWGLVRMYGQAEVAKPDKLRLPFGSSESVGQ